MWFLVILSFIVVMMTFYPVPVAAAGIDNGDEDGSDEDDDTQPPPPWGGGDEVVDMHKDKEQQRRRTAKGDWFQSDLDHADPSTSIPEQAASILEVVRKLNEVTAEACGPAKDTDAGDGTVAHPARGCKVDAIARECFKRFFWLPRKHPVAQYFKAELMGTALAMINGTCIGRAWQQQEAQQVEKDVRPRDGACAFLVDGDVAAAMTVLTSYRARYPDAVFSIDESCGPAWMAAARYLTVDAHAAEAKQHNTSAAADAAGGVVVVVHVTNADPDPAWEIVHRVYNAADMVDLVVGRGDNADREFPSSGIQGVSLALGALACHGLSDADHGPIAMQAVVWQKRAMRDAHAVGTDHPELVHGGTTHSVHNVPGPSTLDAALVWSILEAEGCVGLRVREKARCDIAAAIFEALTLARGGVASEDLSAADERRERIKVTFTAEQDPRDMVHGRGPSMPDVKDVVDIYLESPSSSSLSPSSSKKGTRAKTLLCVSTCAGTKMRNIFDVQRWQNECKDVPLVWDFPIRERLGVHVSTTSRTGTSDDDGGDGGFVARRVEFAMPSISIDNNKKEAERFVEAWSSAIACNIKHTLWREGLQERAMASM